MGLVKVFQEHGWGQGISYDTGKVCLYGAAEVVAFGRRPELNPRWDVYSEAKSFYLELCDAIRHEIAFECGAVTPSSAPSIDEWNDDYLRTEEEIMLIAKRIDTALGLE
jgi:hypothetical protein